MVYFRWDTGGMYVWNIPVNYMIYSFIDWIKHHAFSFFDRIEEEIVTSLLMILDEVWITLKID